MDDSPPALSVITPVLNGGAFFADCLASVSRLASDMPGAIEHIIADGGSSDGTLDTALSALERADSPVSRVLEGPDRGQSHAINRGAAAARGRWIAWLNADDAFVASARRLATQLVAGSHADAEVVVGRCRFVDETGRVVFSPMPPDLSTADDMLRPLTRWFAGRCIVQPEAFIRREAFGRVRGLDESNHLAMDHDLWLRLMRDGARFATVETLVAHQRVHPGQKTVDNLGVARQILKNCRNHIAHAGPADAAVAVELAQLGGRIDAVDRVLRSRRCVVPFTRRAAMHALTAALASIAPRPSNVLVVGGRAMEALRPAGWRDGSATIASSPIAVPSCFGAVVLDCTAQGFCKTWVDRAWKSVQPGGVLVLAACVTVQGRERVLDAVRGRLGDEVTARHWRWSDEMLVPAAQLVGWLRGSAAVDLPRTGVGRSSSVSLAFNTSLTGFMKTLAADLPDCGQVLVLSKLDSGRVR